MTCSALGGSTLSFFTLEHTPSFPLELFGCRKLAHTPRRLGSHPLAYAYEVEAEDSFCKSFLLVASAVAFWKVAFAVRPIMPAYGMVALAHWRNLHTLNLHSGFVSSQDWARQSWQ